MGILTLRGFTLIELMIVTVIIGIVVGIASLGTWRVQVKAHLASIVADGRMLFAHRSATREASTPGF